MAGCAVLALVAGRVAHAQRADSLPRPALEATYRTAPIIIDGRLDEADWSRQRVRRMVSPGDGRSRVAAE